MGNFNCIQCIYSSFRKHKVALTKGQPTSLDKISTITSPKQKAVTFLLVLFMSQALRIKSGHRTLRLRRSSQLGTAPRARSSDRPHKVKTKIKAQAMYEAENVRFWGRYIDDPKAVDERNLLRMLFRGIPRLNNIRYTIWQLLCPMIGSSPDMLRVEDDQGLVSQHIDIQFSQDDPFKLVRSYSSQQFDTAAIKRIVLSLHTQLNYMHALLPGSVTLTALLLEEICLQSESTAFKLVYTVYSVVIPYLENNQSGFRNECLMVAEMLSRFTPDLAAHLNASGYDLIDLSDFVCSWVTSIFLNQFERRFVLRFLDVFFLKGPQVVSNIAFGIFKHQHHVLLSCVTDKQFQNAIFEIPLRVNALPDYEDIFREAYLVYLAMPQLEKIREERDWTKCIEHEGHPSIRVGVGEISTNEDSQEKRHEDEAALLEKKNLLRIKLTKSLLEEEVQEGLAEELDAPVVEITLEEFVQGLEDPVTFYDERLCKLVQSSDVLRRDLDDSRKDDKDMDARLRYLENSILKLEKKRSHQDGSAGLLRSYEINNPDNQIAKFVEQLQHLEENDEVLLPINPRDGLSDADNVLEFDLGAFKTVYSTLHEILPHPCLTMEGYLSVLRTGLFGKKTLTRYWFVLKGSFLTYVKSAAHPKPPKDRCLDLTGGVVVPVSSHPSAVNGESVIEISMPEGKYLLFAESDREMFKWLLALHAPVRSII